MSPEHVTLGPVAHPQQANGHYVFLTGVLAARNPSSPGRAAQPSAAMRWASQASDIGYR